MKVKLLQADKGRFKTKKPLSKLKEAFVIAGAGLEPATSGL